jgi:hypothetical protein
MGFRAELNLDEWPFHHLCSSALFVPVTNCTEADIWTIKALLDPFEALQLTHFP